MMESQRYNKYLCCVGASVLLNIVTNHEIHFNYQEVAIIKKFNQALQNTEVEDDFEETSKEDESESEEDFTDSKKSQSEPKLNENLEESEEKGEVIKPKKTVHIEADSKDSSSSSLIDSKKV